MQLKMNKLSPSVSVKTAIVGLICLFATPVVAQDDIDAKASSVLESMSNYLTSQETFSVNAEATVEIVTLDGQKLQFISSAAAVMQRPGNLFLSRKGAVMVKPCHFGLMSCDDRIFQILIQAVI